MARMTQMKILKLAYEKQYEKWLGTEKQMKEMPDNFLARTMYEIAWEELREISGLMEAEAKKEEGK